MANPGFSLPSANSAIINVVDASGNTVGQGYLNAQGSIFFQTLYSRVGGSAGTGSTTFNYPATAGSKGQLLTSQGAGSATSWSNPVTKTSQLVNDSTFVTTAQLGNQNATTNAMIATYVQGQLSNDTPKVETTNGTGGVSTAISRSDHAHPRETAPVFGGQAKAASFAIGAVTWTSGSGAPAGVAPNGSLYSRTNGTTGARLYVSNGATWAAVAGV